ncbi:MAG: DUF2059 domain-containing protein [Alsobacter sp.]
MIRTSFRRLPILAAFGLSLAAGPALAQQAAPAAPAPAAPAAPAPAPTASHLAVAKEVINASGLGRNFDFLVPQLMDQLRNAFAQTRPEIMDELTKTLVALKPEFDQQKEVVMNAAATAYASALSEAELKDIAAFFKSPAGVRYVTTQPQVLDKLYAEMQTWSRSMSDLMLARTRQEMKKKNIDM